MIPFSLSWLLASHHNEAIKINYFYLTAGGLGLVNAGFILEVKAQEDTIGLNLRLKVKASNKTPELSQE